MATKRRPPPQKNPPTTLLSRSDVEVDGDVRSSSEEETEVERNRKPLESESSEEDGEGSGGDETSEDEDDSESEEEKLTPNPPRPRSAAADEDNDDDGDNDESGEGDSESESVPEPEEEKLNPSTQKSDVTRPAKAIGNPSGEKSLPISESEEEDSESGEEDSESEEVPTKQSLLSSAVTHTGSGNGNPSDKKSVTVSQSREVDSESEEETPNPTPQKTAIGNGNPWDKKSVPVSNSEKDDATPLKAATGETAKKLFQRIWSDEDQIALLQGMVEYVGTEVKDPVANIDEFSLFIGKKLSFPVTKSQLLSKISTVRKKYRSRSMSSNNGKERAFSKAYDAEVFELSKKVWGDMKSDGNGGVGKGKGVENDPSRNGKKRKGVPLDKESVRDSPCNEPLASMPWYDEVINLYKEHFGCDEYSAMAKINSMEESERKPLLSRWTKLKMDEIKSFKNRRSLELDTLEAMFNTS